MQITKRIPPKLKLVADSIRAQLANDELIKLEYMPSKIDVGTDWISGIIDRSITGHFKNYNAVRVGQYKFYQCTELTEVTLFNAGPIGNNAFAQCTSLTKANLPAATRIEAGAFGGCTNLNLINFYNPDRDSICYLASTTALNNTPIINGDGYVVINDEKVNEMKAASNWSTLPEGVIIGNTQAAQMGLI